MITEACDQEVYEKGISLGYYDMTKEEAEECCQKETERTGHKHDWHYFGGRVHVKKLVPNAEMTGSRTK